MSEEGPQLKTCQHQMVQTDLHILPPSIDKNYSSNLWELRNRALHLVSTVNKQYKGEGKISFSSF